MRESMYLLHTTFSVYVQVAQYIYDLLCGCTAYHRLTMPYDVYYIIHLTDATASF
jgi:hypothetical protein